MRLVVFFVSSFICTTSALRHAFSQFFDSGDAREINHRLESFRDVDFSARRDTGYFAGFAKLLLTSHLTSGFKMGSIARSHGCASVFVSSARAAPAQLVDRSDLPSFPVELEAPFGLNFQECEDGPGVQVLSLETDKSAERSQVVFPFDYLLEVNGNDVSELPLAQLIVGLEDAESEGGVTEFTFARQRGLITAVRFTAGPEQGRLFFALPGGDWENLCGQAQFPLKFACKGKGQCGTCNAAVSDTEYEDDLELKLLCMAKPPGGDSGSLMPIEVHLPTSEKGMEAARKIEERVQRLR